MVFGTTRPITILSDMKANYSYILDDVSDKAGNKLFKML